MKDNKLIAEFMGAVGTPKYNPTEWDVYITGVLDVDSDHENAQHFYTPDEMKYHTSWDWMMPVVRRIVSDVVPFARIEDEYREHLMDVVPFARIEDVYEAVVEFINEYNKHNL
jgi:hypothetical protein